MDRTAREPHLRVGGFVHFKDDFVISDVQHRAQDSADRLHAVASLEVSLIIVCRFFVSLFLLLRLNMKKTQQQQDRPNCSSIGIGLGTGWAVGAAPSAAAVPERALALSFNYARSMKIVEHGTCRGQLRSREPQIDSSSCLSSAVAAVRPAAGSVRGEFVRISPRQSPGGCPPSTVGRTEYYARKPGSGQASRPRKKSAGSPRA